MPWISRDEETRYLDLEVDLSRLQDELQYRDDRIAALERDAARNIETLDGYLETNDDLRAHVQRLEQANPFNKLIAAEMIAMEQRGEIDLQAAQTAAGVVGKRYRDQSVAFVADALISDRAELILAQHGPEEIRKLEAEKDEAMSKDGTYAKVDAETTAEVHADVRSKLIDKRRDDVAEHLATPAIHSAMVGEEAARLQADGTYAALEREMVKGLVPVWREQAVNLARQQITVKLEAEREAYIEQYGQDWSESYEGREIRSDIEKRLKKEWKQATIAQITAAVENEELRKLVEAKAEAMVTDLTREAIFRNHLRSFLRGGMDTTALPADSEIVIQMGDVSERQKLDGYSHEKVPTLVVARQIIMSALGEQQDHTAGLFVVTEDTLGESKDPYILDNALIPGDTVTIGRTIKAKGKEVLHQRLLKGVVLAYDHDPSDPEHENARLTVANVLIDGISARDDIAQIQMPNGKVTKLAA